MDYPVLYKYMKREYAAALLNRGAFRIGTLYEYRKTELYGTEIGDNREGQISNFMHTNGETWTPENMPAFASSMFKLAPGASMTISGITLQNAQNSPDLFLYCVTKEFDESVMMEFGCDACIRINNPGLFFNALQNEMKRYGRWIGIGECVYMPRDLPHSLPHRHPPSLIKGPDYTHQKEVRAAWLPYHTNPKPKLITSMEAARQCSLYWPHD